MLVHYKGAKIGDANRFFGSYTFLLYNGNNSYVKKIVFELQNQDANNIKLKFNLSRNIFID